MSAGEIPKPAYVFPGPPPPPPQTISLRTYGEPLAKDAEDVEAPLPASWGEVNMPITWPQLLGGWLSDAPFFLMAALGVVATWLQSSAPVTTRGAVIAVILAILAGLTAVQRATGTDGLSLRLRSMGQIRSGK
jgi:hypothetical protein